MDTTDRLAPWSSHALAVLRIMTGLLFMEHGTQKLFAFPPGSSPDTVQLFSLMGLAGVLETFGGLLIVIGLFTRQVAFVLAGMMAVAYFMAHAPRSFFPVNNAGDAAILFCFIYLYLVVVGPGAWSVDRMRDRG